MGEEQVAMIGGGICYCLIFITSLILIIRANSFGTVPINMVGLPYSDTYKTIENRLYYPGYHNIGLSYTFKLYSVKLTN